MIVGHAAVFNRMSEDLGFFREKIEPGAFKQTLADKDDVRALFNHDPNNVLGRSTAGTLRLKEDDEGLRVEIDPPDTQLARDLMVSIDRGDVSQMSFGFETRKDEWDHSDKQNPVRTLVDVKLYDVSPVTFPAYPDTDVAARAWAAWNKGEPFMLPEHWSGTMQYVDEINAKGMWVGGWRARTTDDAPAYDLTGAGQTTYHIDKDKLRAKPPTPFKRLRARLRLLRIR